MKIFSLKNYLFDKTVGSNFKKKNISFNGEGLSSKRNIFLFLGPPNAGKGTCCRRLSKEFSIPHIGMGEILRSEIKKNSLVAHQAVKFMESGELVPDELIMDIFNKRIEAPDCKKGFVLDGFPRTMSQAKYFKEMLDKLKNINFKIFSLLVNKENVLERSKRRFICPTCRDASYTFAKDVDITGVLKCECGETLVKRKDDTPEIMTKRFNQYERQGFPIIRFFKDKKFDVVDIVEDNASKEEIAENIVNHLR